MFSRLEHGHLLPCADGKHVMVNNADIQIDRNIYPKAKHITNFAILLS
jgi:hypothetical protein